jgi:hypothetical protein
MQLLLDMKSEEKMKDKEVEQADASMRRRLLTKRDTLIQYLIMKVDEEDWHAVCDAGMDLREIDVKLETLNGRN